MRNVITISILIDQIACAHAGPLHAQHLLDENCICFLNDRRLTHVLCQCAGHGIVQIDASMAVSMSNVSEIYTEKGNDMRRVRQRQKRHKDKDKYMYLYSLMLTVVVSTCTNR